MKHNQNFAGFTLIELLISLVIAGTIMAIALPAFNNTMSNSKVTSNTNLLVGALNLARTQAIESGVRVTVRPISSGWEVVSDPGGASQEQLKVFEPSTQDITITTGLAEVAYEATGFRASGASASNLLIEDTKTGVKRRICVSMSGSVKVTDGTAC